MAVRFFGQYLLENGVIDARQLLAAIAYQEKTNLKFGDMAISLGLLSQDQLAAVFALQRSKDVRAGEAAIMLGYMTQAQVDQVLRAQQNSHVMLGEALVATAGLTRESLTKHLAAFKQDQEAYKVTEDIPSAVDPTGVGRPAVDLARKFLLRLANISTKLTETAEGMPAAPEKTTYTSRVGFTGDVKGEIALRAPTDVCARIASAMLGEPVAADDKEAVLDATAEFLNVVGGNLAAAAARIGKRLDLAAPKQGEIAAPAGGEHLLVAVLSAPEGRIEFFVLTAS